MPRRLTRFPPAHFLPSITFPPAHDDQVFPAACSLTAAASLVARCCITRCQMESRSIVIGISRSNLSVLLTLSTILLVSWPYRRPGNRASAQDSGWAFSRYVAAAAFVSRSFCNAALYFPSVRARATAQNNGARPRPNFSVKFSFRWWQQCATAISGPRIGSARSKPLSRSEIKVQSSRKIPGMASPRCRKNHSHDCRFSDSTTAHARIVLWPSASMPTASKSVCMNRPLRNVPSTARKRRDKSKHS